jgi:DNA-binding MarR family transcriptional regulator
VGLSTEAELSRVPQYQYAACVAAVDGWEAVEDPGTGRRSELEAPPVALWDLVQTAHLAGRRFAAVFASHGLSPAQYGVLASLADGDDLSQAELARAVLVRPQSMARLVSAMVEAGLVERVGTGGRGRRTGLVLTASGQKAFRAARPAARATSTPEALGLSATENAQLVALLATVRQGLARDIDGDPGVENRSETSDTDGVGR